MTSPVKPLSLLVDEVIENEIDRWVEERHKDEEAEQLWLKIEKEIDGQEDRANDYD